MIPGLAQFADILIDSYFIVDMERNIVDFNRAFHSMLPRKVARKLKTKKCHEVLQLDICKDGCIAEQCWKNNAHVRLDEIGGRVEGDDRELRFILSAIPLRDENGEVVGVLEVQRNVTDEALVQAKYQQQVDASARQLKLLEEELRLRTRRLMDVSRRLFALQKELLSARTDLFG